MQQGPQLLPFAFIQHRLDGLRAAGLRFEALQATALEIPQEIAHGLGSAAQTSGHLGDPFPPGASQKHLAATYREGLARTHPSS